MGGSSLAEAGGESLADPEQVARIELDVRIAGSMDVAPGTIEHRRHVEHGHVACRFEIARTAGLDIGIAGIAHDERQPADFKIGASRHDQIGAPRLRQQRRPRLDAVRILQPGGRREHADLVATDFAGQGAPLRDGREDLQGCQRGDAGSSQQNGHQ